MTQNKQTFSQILNAVEKKNSERLMKKARAANRLAKSSHGSQRRKAYALKSGALASLVKNIPARVAVRRDPDLSEFVVVELKSTNQALHFPISNLHRHLYIGD